MIVSRLVRVNDGKSDRYGFALDNVRVARQEPRVFRSSLLPAVVKETGDRSVLVPTKWNVLCSALPLGWEEAMQRSEKGEPS